MSCVWVCVYVVEEGGAGLDRGAARRLEAEAGGAGGSQVSK